jgi:endonuclease/exonuclease/phosphatase family metal-dependent hydrolase
MRPLRLLSFNVRYNTPDDGTNAWPHRRDLAASVLRFHRVDLAGLQEDHTEHVADLGKRLPEFGFAAADTGNEGGAEGELVSVAYRNDRLDPVEAGTRWLSQSGAPGSVGWDAALPRIVSWAAFEYGGERFYQFNTHLDHVGERARERSAARIVSAVREIAGGAPAVLTGDLNCRPGTPPHDRLTGPDAPFRDAMAASEYPHHGPTTTFNEAFEGVVPDAKIDHVLVTDDVAVRQHGVLADHWDGRYPSDHFPVLAEVEPC